MPISLLLLKKQNLNPERVCSVLSLLHLLTWVGATAGLLAYASPERAAVSVASVVSERVVLNLDRVIVTESSVDLAAQEPVEEIIEKPDPELLIEPEPAPTPGPEPVEELEPLFELEPIPESELEPVKEKPAPQEAIAGSVASGSSAAAVAEKAIIDAAENSQQAQLVYAELRAWIEKCKSYPTIARRLRSQGTVTVYIELNAGRISAYEVIENTGHRSLKSGLEKTMKRVQREFQSSYIETIDPIKVAVEYVLE